LVAVESAIGVHMEFGDGLVVVVVVGVWLHKVGRRHLIVALEYHPSHLESRRCAQGPWG
jgi:hypothetical protein